LISDDFGDLLSESPNREALSGRKLDLDDRWTRHRRADD